MERVLSTVAFSMFGRTLLLVLTTRDPSPGDWSIWAQTYANAAVEHDVRSLFVVSEGGGPNSAQRRQVVEAIVAALGADNPDLFRTAICSDSAAARFITAALGWLYAISNMKVFPADQRREALQFLHVEDDGQAPIMAAIPRLQEALRAHH